MRRHDCGRTGNGRLGRRRAAQNRLDAGEQLAQVERLGDVVVRADLEADDLVDGVPPAGHDDQAAVPVLAQLTRDREAVLAGQAEIQQDERRRIGRHQGEQRAPVVHLRDPVAVDLQIACKQLGDVDFVVENGDVQGELTRLREGTVCAGRAPALQAYQLCRARSPGQRPLTPGSARVAGRPQRPLRAVRLRARAFRRRPGRRCSARRSAAPAGGADDRLAAHQATAIAAVREALARLRDLEQLAAIALDSASRVRASLDRAARSCWSSTTSLPARPKRASPRSRPRADARARRVLRARPADRWATASDRSS